MYSSLHFSTNALFHVDSMLSLVTSRMLERKSWTTVTGAMFSVASFSAVLNAGVPESLAVEHVAEGGCDPKGLKRAWVDGSILRNDEVRLSRVEYSGLPLGFWRSNLNHLSGGELPRLAVGIS